jgi:2-amino-4-hydroxy-6-hydroxymethyldihydropteridine diphosphokinase/dihydropteroate synthase
MLYVIGIGSNLGDKVLNIAVALKLIAKQLEIVKLSRTYESKALLYKGSPKSWDKDFINMAILLDFHEEPMDLLKTLQSIETEVGREKNAPRWSPRAIDLDILIAQDLILEKEKLQIPHPELLNRDFALIPACEVAPDFIHYVAKKSLKDCVLDLKQKT